MFRNALRQSSRTVGAISASGRVAAVRPSIPNQMLHQAICNQSRSIDNSLRSSIDALVACVLVVGSCWASFNSYDLTFFRASANWHFLFRDELPHPQLSTQHQNKSEATHPLTRHRQPKCHLSSSKESEVSRRSPASPRQVVFCPSGTLHHNKHDNNRSYT